MNKKIPFTQYVAFKYALNYLVGKVKVTLSVNQFMYLFI